MNPLPQPNSSTTPRPPLAQDAERQEILACFLSSTTNVAKPALPMNASLTITVRGETTVTAAPLALVEMPEKVVVAKNALPATANNVVAE